MAADMSQHAANILRSLASFSSDVTDDVGADVSNGWLPLLHFVGFAVVTAAAIRRVGRQPNRLRITHDEGDLDRTGHSEGTPVYHESARSIVFRDHLREQQQAASEAARQQGDDGSSPRRRAVIPGYTPALRPFPDLKFEPSDEFQPLVEVMENMSEEEVNEQEDMVVSLLREERAVVKTIRNADWAHFLQQLESDVPFRTSTSLLPSMGKQMRCYGSSAQHSVGVVFALPRFSSADAEDTAAEADTWCWPSGFSAKTEFNVDRHGKLTHGRKEALVPVSALRKHNHAYLHDDEYTIAGHISHRSVGSHVPYNEIHCLVGGHSRKEGTECGCSMPSLDNGIGHPVALFVRTASFSHLMNMLRVRAHMASLPGFRISTTDVPLLFITPESGVKVLTQRLQVQLLQYSAGQVNPFQNSALFHQQPTDIAEIDNFNREHLQQKVEELLDLNDSVCCNLNLEEKARIAGGFGATDDSVHRIFVDAQQEDRNYRTRQSESYDKEADDESNQNGQQLQRVLNAALVWAVRASDYHTARQVLIMHTLVASTGHEGVQMKEKATTRATTEAEECSTKAHRILLPICGEKSIILVKNNHSFSDTSKSFYLPSDALTPPVLNMTRHHIDIDRLRSATDLDGLLVVLGAEEVLNSIQKGAVKGRLEEAVSAIEDWVANGEQSLFYRLSSWKNQRAAQHDLNIASEHKTNFTAFIGYHAITNRKKFANRLRDAAEKMGKGQTKESLRSLLDTVLEMNRPSLRLELLQCVFGLDNRYSVPHIARSLELAAFCLSYRDACVEQRSVAE